MKKALVKFFDKIIVLLLGFSGFFNGCAISDPTDEYGSPYAEYGMPHADFVIKGVITDKETSNPIQNIQVIRQIYPEYGDTIYTNAEGEYAFEFGNFPPWPENAFHLKIEDIDGEENGGLFNTQEIDVMFTQADQVEKGKGWYEGKFVKTQDIELDRIVIAPEYGAPFVTFKP